MIARFIAELRWLLGPSERVAVNRFTWAPKL
jgi:hypothetical protein